jgi:TolB protein
MMSVAGGSMMRLPTNISNYCAEPDWSTAKPNMIAFTAAVGASFQVAIYDLSSRQSQIVTRGGGDSIEPCWLADGRHLICTARSAGVRQLKIVDTETGRMTMISPAALGQASQANYWKR